MNVAHLDTGRAWRGGQAQVLLLLDGLRARGHGTFLMAPEGPLLERAAAGGHETMAWRPRGDWDLLATWRARAALRARRPDLVHCHSAAAHACGVPAARASGIPVLVARRVAKPVGRHVLSRFKYRMPVDRYLCVSRHARDVLRDAGLPEARLAVVPSGIRLDVLAAVPDGGGELRRSLGVAPDAPLIGAVGALTAEKGPDVFVASARLVAERFPDAAFVWIGDGPLRPQTERRIAALGLEARVHLLGFRADAHTLVRQLTLLTMPSRLEGLGTVLMEAQALGVPVVAAAAGGTVEVVRDRVTGRLVTPGNPAAFASAIIEALEQPAARARWAAAARETVQAFGAERMVEATIEQYDLVLAGRRARS